MIPDARARQPRDGQMKCGNKPGDISLIIVAKGRSRGACPLRCCFFNSKHLITKP
jgi:hypothetical protein